MTVVRWEELAWPEIGALVEAHPTEVGLLPVGATEQHGPHLPAGTDTIVARALAEGVSERTGAPVLPAIAVGVSYGHGTLLPGTFSLTPEGLADTVRQVVTWCAHSGLRRVLIVNGHFGNEAALSVATDHLRLGRPDLRVGVTSWWDLTDEIRALVTMDGADIHANCAETSLMLAIAPELVHVERLEGADDVDRTGALVFRYTAPSLSTNGVTGQPSAASGELGEKLFGAVVAALCATVERGRAEEPPLADHEVIGARR
jgi:creatinine amidohydrolase